jgi:hypothetical protein
VRLDFISFVAQKRMAEISYSDAFEGGAFEEGTFEGGAFEGGAFEGGAFEGGDSESPVGEIIKLVGLGVIALVLGGLPEDVRTNLEAILDEGRQTRNSLSGGSDKQKSQRETAKEVSKLFAKYVNHEAIMNPRTVKVQTDPVKNIFQLKNGIKGGGLIDDVRNAWSSMINSELVQSAVETAKQRTQEGIEIAKSKVKSTFDQVRAMSTDEIIEAAKAGAGTLVSKSVEAAQSIKILVGDMRPTERVYAIRENIRQKAKELHQKSTDKVDEIANNIGKGLETLFAEDDLEPLESGELAGGGLFTPSAGFMASLLFKGEFWTLLIASLRFIALRKTILIDGKSQPLTKRLIAKRFTLLVKAHLRWNTLLAFIVSSMITFPGANFATRAATKWLTVSAASAVTSKMENKHLKILSSLILPGVLVATYYVNFHVAAAAGLTFFVQTMLLLILGHIETSLSSLGYVKPIIGATLSTIGVATGTIKSLMSSLTAA